MCYGSEACDVWPQLVRASGPWQGLTCWRGISLLALDVCDCVTVGAHTGVHMDMCMRASRQCNALACLHMTCQHLNAIALVYLCTRML